MVKTISVKLDWTKHVVESYERGDVKEIVTVPDVGLSIRQMIETGVAGSFGKGFSFPDLDEDDEIAHDSPDFEKLNKLDPVEKQIFVDEWLKNPDNYEKTTIAKVAPQKGGETNKEEGSETNE